VAGTGLDDDDDPAFTASTDTSKNILHIGHRRASLQALITGRAMLAA
jgi:hypothetical protein